MEQLFLLNFTILSHILNRPQEDSFKIMQSRYLEHLFDLLINSFNLSYLSYLRNMCAY